MGHRLALQPWATEEKTVITPVIPQTSQLSNNPFFLLLCPVFLMGLGSSKVAIVLICFGVLALLAHNASATRRMGPRPRLEREQSTFHDGLPNLTRNLSITEHLQEQTAAPAPSTAFDPGNILGRKGCLVMASNILFGGLHAFWQIFCIFLCKFRSLLSRWREAVQVF